MNTHDMTTPAQRLEHEKVVQIRHNMSAALSFIETSIKNISGAHANLPKALKIHERGTSKLKDVLKELDLLIEEVQNSTVPPQDEVRKHDLS